MPFKNLLDTWSENRNAELADERYSVRLSLDDAARVEALAELFPGNPPEQIVTDLLGAALDAIEAAMPYEPGDQVIREDEFGDPIYEDAGLTPKFLALVKTRRKQLGSS